MNSWSGWVGDCGGNQAETAEREKDWHRQKRNQEEADSQNDEATEKQTDKTL
jgi:hypothetical protein